MRSYSSARWAFPWSNYSHSVMAFLHRHAAWFAANGIGLAALWVGDDDDDDVVEAVCPEFLPTWRIMNNEPAMLVIERGSLRQVRYGPIRPEMIMPWVLWDGQSPPPSSTLFPPPDDPLWDRELDSTPASKSKQ